MEILIKNVPTGDKSTRRLIEILDIYKFEYSIQPVLNKTACSVQLPPAEQSVEDEIYCHECGTDNMVYVGNYANGEQWKCRDCEWWGMFRR